MRLLALTAAAAAALLGSGCISSHCRDGSLTIDWQLVGPAGLDLSCTAAGVAYVDVWVDGTLRVDRARCLDGTATLLNVSDGAHTVTVEGLDAALVIIDRDEFSANVSCGDSAYLATPGEITLKLTYGLSPVDQCDANGFVWYEVTDLIANAPISSITSASVAADKTRFTCGDPIAFQVPWGRYRVKWIAEVVDPLTAPVVQHQQCTPSVSKQLFAPGTLIIDSTLPVTGATTCVP